MPVLNIWELGQIYINGTDHVFSSEEIAVIQSFVVQFWKEEILDNGLTVHFVDYQPYKSAKEMISKVNSTKELYISNEGNVSDDDSHPYTSELNLMHRAIHDSHHVMLNAGFNAPGEIVASAYMVKLARANNYPDYVQQFLFSDMVGQVGHYYATGGNYSDQKIVLFDMSLINELVKLYDELGPKGLLEYLTPIDKEARIKHNWANRSAH